MAADTPSLLDWLTEKTNCPYLSNLPEIVGSEAFRSAVKETPPERYPLAEWTEAVQYLCGEKNPCFTDPAGAKRRLIEATGPRCV